MSEEGSLCRLTASQAVGLIRAREISCEELVRACIDRIDAREPMVAAWSHLDPQGALEQARRCDATEPAGLLHGIPVGFKDLCDTADMPTAYGSRAWTGHRPVRDATCVTLTRHAGGIVLGKTVTVEFGAGQPGPTSNPHDRNRTPGGSSSGSAAAVADYMVPLAVGTQTAGSVIRPSSYCGVLGYKPTAGLFSRAGVRPGSETFDSLGCIARSLEDICLMRDVMLGLPETSQPGTLERPPRIGFCRTPAWAEAEPDAQAAIDSTLAALSTEGAEVSELSIAPELDSVLEWFMTIAAFEMARATAFECDTAKDALSQTVRALGDTGRGIAIEDYLKARAGIDQLRTSARETFQSVDALVTLSASGEAPLGLGSTGSPAFAISWQAMGLPALTLPVMTGANGMPIGLQIAGPPYADMKIMSAARWILDALGRHDL